MRLGFSPCPNDTFMFHALVHGIVSVPGVSFDPELLDIEQLNRRAASPDPLEVTKLSAAAYAALRDRYELLAAGAALGRGVGPLVVARPSDGSLRSLADLAGRRVAIPGTRTTAYLLLRMFGPPTMRCDALPFHRILDAVATGDFDAGLIIHESRFTYADHGLRSIADLGTEWERRTGLPLPLGVIAARRDLERDLRDEIGRAIAESVRHAQRHPGSSAEYVAAHAQEMAATVCAQHIQLYVNEYSVDLGGDGRRAIETLIAQAETDPG
ncbi:MAG: 1,4-dihydroxy-6-naphthoate synthase [Planctomycetota bacterium]